MRTLIPGYEVYFDESEFRPLMFKPDYNWQFQKPEPYKHYFYVFDRQVKGLPNGQADRIEILKGNIRNAVNLFRTIENDVFLDDDSDGSHLPTWFNVINAYQKEIA